MPKFTGDRSVGWFGIAIGTMLAGVAANAILPTLANDVPRLVIRSVTISGTQALLAASILALAGLSFVLVGVWCLRTGQRT